MGIAGYVFVCVKLYCMLVFTVFTTCFGLHGHLQVCRILHIFIFICLRILLRCFFGSAFGAAQNRQTTTIKSKQKTQKKNHEGKQHRNKRNGKHAECDHVKKRQRTKKAAKQNP
jgi:hypothetical protein